MGGCMGQWVGSGQMTNLIKLELINIIWFCLKIYNLLRDPYLWVDGWVNGWAHVKPLKSNKSWPDRDNSIMDILDILLDILLKPPQPFILTYWQRKWLEYYQISWRFLRKFSMLDMKVTTTLKPHGWPADITVRKTYIWHCQMHDR